jgi:hypothetical protein
VECDALVILMDEFRRQFLFYDPGEYSVSHTVTCAKRVKKLAVEGRDHTDD